MTLFHHISAIALGAILGALLRWHLGLWLAKATALLSLHTLLANWIGALLIGMAAALFDHHPALPAQWKLFFITGFLGSLSTFSSFSLEIVEMLHAQRYGAAFLTASLHLFGSLALTIAGMALIHKIQS